MKVRRNKSELPESQDIQKDEDGEKASTHTPLPPPAPWLEWGVWEGERRRARFAWLTEETPGSAQTVPAAPSPKLIVFLGLRSKQRSGRHESRSCLAIVTRCRRPLLSPLTALCLSGPGLHELSLQKHRGLEHWQRASRLHWGQLQPPPDVPAVLQQR